MGNKYNWGGARENAGRPVVGWESKQVSIPARFIPAVKDFVEFMKTAHNSEVKCGNTRCRGGDDKLVEVEYKVRKLSEAR